MFADRDLSDGHSIVCRPLSQLPGIIKGGYYVVKLLNELAKVGAPAGLREAVLAAADEPEDA